MDPRGRADLGPFSFMTEYSQPVRALLEPVPSDRHSQSPIFVVVSIENDDRDIALNLLMTSGNSFFRGSRVAQLWS